MCDEIPTETSNTQETHLSSNRYLYPTNEKIDQDNLLSRIRWALTTPTEAEAEAGLTSTQVKVILKNLESKWGNSLIEHKEGKHYNLMWSATLGENLVFDVLQRMGKNPQKLKTNHGLRPDLESDDYIYEVKTMNWYGTGTAGEKVLGTFIKYRNVPEIYGKPLRIVCLGKQENELAHGKTQYFGENLCPRIQTILDLAKSWNIEYITFSQLVKESGIDISLLQL